MQTPSLLAFAGSTRAASFNKQLVKIAAQGAEEAGVSTTFVDLADYPLPLFDEDLEAANGMPLAAVELKQLMIQHQGFLIASPEYNSSVSGVLKNTIDWVSRAAEGESPLIAFSGKAAALLSASPGGLGGIRGLVHLRSILGNIGMNVLPDQVTISSAHKLFDATGNLQDPAQEKKVKALGASLAKFCKKHYSE